MDLKLAMIALFFLVVMAAMSEAGHKKVVIHVPLKVKKLKHTHTIYKTVHHFKPHHHHDHHGSHSHHYDHHFDFDHDGEDHEHFHHHGDLHGFGSVLSPVVSVRVQPLNGRQRLHKSSV